MKIIHICDSLNIGGAERLIHDLAVIQATQGHDVTVVCIVGTKSFLIESLSTNNVKVLSLWKGTRFKQIYNPYTIFKLRKFINGADVAHVHLFPANYWSALCKIIFRIKTKLVLTEHSTNNKRRDKRFLKPIERWIYRQYDEIVACSDKANLTLSSFLDTSRICTVVNGVNTQSFRNAEPYEKNDIIGPGIDNPFTVTMVARFTFPKDQQTLIKALKYTSKNVHVVFVGDGVNRAACEQLAEVTGVRNRCHFLGIRNDVAKLIKTSDVNVLSSKWEGLSLSSIECMASGKPFIGTNVNGIKEIVEGAGLMFEYHDEKGLAELINKLMSSHELYRNIAEKCVIRSSSYDISLCAKEYMELYTNR